MWEEFEDKSPRAVKSALDIVCGKMPLAQESIASQHSTRFLTPGSILSYGKRLSLGPTSHARGSFVEKGSKAPVRFHGPCHSDFHSTSIMLIVLPSGWEISCRRKRLSAFSSKRSQSALVRSALLKQVAMIMSKFLSNGPLSV